MDDIQRKLKLIDKQLEGTIVNFHKHIISTAPLLFCAVGLIIGIIIQNVLNLPVLTWLILLVLLTVIIALFFIIKKSSFSNYQSSNIKYQYAIAYIALVYFIYLGAIRLVNFSQAMPNDIRNFVTNERKLTTLRGTILTEPYINYNKQWQFAKFKPADPTSSFYLKINEVKTTTGWAKVLGTVRVQIAEPAMSLKAGDYIQAYCWLDRFKSTTNPGQFNLAKHLARRNVFVAAFVKSRDGIKVLKHNTSNSFTKIQRVLRQTVMHALIEDTPLGEETHHGLLEAMLLGYRGNVSSETYRTFRKTGLLHFISLSGMHLGILMGIIWWLCKTAGLMKPVRSAICIIAIGIFLLIVPPRAPTLRAAIIGFVFYISFFFRRKSNPLNTLSLAAIILLLIRPTCLFEAGWQLSFTSVLGILLFTGRIYFFLHEKIVARLWPKEILRTRSSLRIVPRTGSYLLRLFSMGLAAWLGGAGVLLYHFYTINPLVSIWTVAVFPLIALILTTGYLKIIFSFLLPTVASLLSQAITAMADLLIWIVKFIASWDISEILIGKVSIVLIVCYYSFILFAAFGFSRRHLLKKAICIITALAIIVFLGTTKWQRTYRDNLILTCLDVGHGQAILAQLPGKSNVLFDAGSLHKNNVGRRIITPFLNYSGINKIDCIIISHNDIDHINGIPEITEYCKINGVYANKSFLDKADKYGTAGFLSEYLSKKGFEIKKLEDLNLNSTSDIKILWPTEQIRQNENLSDNAKSTVTMIEFDNKRILLCSDIEKFAQRQLLQLYPHLQADIIVVPHHGSANTLAPDFLERIKADILIYSCSQRQYENQYVTEPISKMKRFYTSKDGAITLCIDKNDIVTKTCVNNSK